MNRIVVWLRAHVHLCKVVGCAVVNGRCLDCGAKK